jgi:hypothetical protein
MILRFIYGSVNNEYQYEDKKLKIIDEHLDENKIRSLFASGLSLLQDTKAVILRKDVYLWTLLSVIKLICYTFSNEILSLLMSFQKR